MKSPAQAVILCGGLGSRLRPLTDSMPKPMIPVNGRPFLEHLLKQVADQGIRRFILLTGYLGEQIRDYFGDGSGWGWEIDYSQGPVEWETGRRLWEAREKLDPQFFLLYSDNFVLFSMDRLLALHKQKKAMLSLLITFKSNGNMRVSSEGSVEVYDKTRSSNDLNFVELGYMAVERDQVLGIFSNLEGCPNLSFSAVLEQLARNGHLAGLIVHDAYHSVSDPERLKLMRTYLAPKKLLLIDRDGVINKRPPKGEYVASWNEFKWIPETREAMRTLANRDYKFVVISNQAGIGRGVIDPNAVEQIHRNMILELRKDGVDILNVYFCPHHWDDKCFCRKPSPGLFFRASRDHLLRIDRTIYIGDDTRDCLAADNAGCLSVLVGPESGSLDVMPFFRAKTLSEAIPSIDLQFQDWADNSAMQLNMRTTRSCQNY